MLARCPCAAHAGPLHHSKHVGHGEADAILLVPGGCEALLVVLQLGVKFLSRTPAAVSALTQQRG